MYALELYDLTRNVTECKYMNTYMEVRYQFNISTLGTASSRKVD